MCAQARRWGRYWKKLTRKHTKRLLMEMREMDDTQDSFLRRALRALDRGAHPGETDNLGDFITTARVIPISVLAILVGVLSAFVALILLRLIGLFTNLFFFGR